MDQITLKDPCFIVVQFCQELKTLNDLLNYDSNSPHSNFVPGIIEKRPGNQQPSPKAHQCGQLDREGVRQHWGGRKRGEQKNQNPKRMRKGAYFRSEERQSCLQCREHGPRSAPSSILLLCRCAHGRAWVSKGILHLTRIPVDTHAHTHNPLPHSGIFCLFFMLVNGLLS